MPAVADPKTVRLELLGAQGTTASIRYQGDVGAATKLETVALPWAVEAPLSAGNRHVQLTANDTKPSTDPMNQGTLLCRIYLDGVIVEQTVGHGYAQCASWSTGSATRPRRDPASPSLRPVQWPPRQTACRPCRPRRDR